MEMSTALIVIDAQNIYTNPDSELYCKDADKTLANINMLVRHFTDKGFQIIFVRHIHKADGSDLGRMFDYLNEEVKEFNFVEGSEEVEYAEDLIRPKNSIEIVKNRYSAFAGTQLDSKLKELRITRVVICGFMTNFCCESTAREAHDRDYFVDFIIDATGTPGTENLSQTKIRNIVGELLEEGIARIMPTNESLACY